MNVFRNRYRRTALSLGGSCSATPLPGVPLPMLMIGT